VVVVSTANGLKFTDFKTRYHEGKLGAPNSAEPSAPAQSEPRYANQPTLLPNEYVAVRDSVRRILD